MDNILNVIVLLLFKMYRVLNKKARVFLNTCLYL